MHRRSDDLTPSPVRRSDRVPSLHKPSSSNPDRSSRLAKPFDGRHTGAQNQSTEIMNQFSGKPVRLGITYVPAYPPEGLREAVRAAESAGLDDFWLWEDSFAHGGLSTAAVALASSRHIRVGIDLLPVPLRNVVVTAMEFATLHRTFPGRVLAGVGHGVQGFMSQCGARSFPDDLARGVSRGSTRPPRWSVRDIPRCVRASRRRPASLAAGGSEGVAPNIAPDLRRLSGSWSLQCGKCPGERVRVRLRRSVRYDNRQLFDLLERVVLE